MMLALYTALGIAAVVLGVLGCAYQADDYLGAALFCFVLAACSLFGCAFTGYRIWVGMIPS